MIPKTLKDAIGTLLLTLSEEEVDYLIDANLEQVFDLHFSLGTWIRNEFKLWTENKELINNLKAVDADDASIIILRVLWEIAPSLAK